MGLPSGRLRRCETADVWRSRTRRSAVLASLIEKEASVPESYPLSLNAARLACNQSTNRRPVVSYDDRTVENVLMSLKSVGLVRFVHPSHGGRTTRYRHTAGERWRLSPGELLVLSALVLRGAQTAQEVRARVQRLLPADEESTVDEMLDTLAARSPDAFVVRIGRRPGERDDRWASVLGDPATIGEHDGDDTGELRLDDPALDAVTAIAVRGERPTRNTVPEAAHDGLAERVDQLVAALAEVTARLARSNTSSASTEPPVNVVRLGGP